MFLKLFRIIFLYIDVKLIKFEVDLIFIFSIIVWFL